MPHSGDFVAVSLVENFPVTAFSRKILRQFCSEVLPQRHVVVITTPNHPVEKFPMSPTNIEPQEVSLLSIDLWLCLFQLDLYFSPAVFSCVLFLSPRVVPAAYICYTWIL